MAFDVGAVYALSLTFVYSRIGFSFAQIIGITPNVQLRCLQNRVQPLPHSGIGHTSTRAQTNRFSDFMRHGPRPKEDSASDTPQLRESPDLFTIEETDEENIHSSGSMLFSSHQPSGYCDTSDLSVSSFGVTTESSIQFSEGRFSDDEVREFPPCPEDMPSNSPTTNV